MQLFNYAIVDQMFVEPSNLRNYLKPAKYMYIYKYDKKSPG